VADSKPATVVFDELGPSEPLLAVVAVGSCPGSLWYLPVVDYLELGHHDVDPILGREDTQVASPAHE
jgi:hypothetical protein